MSRWQQEKKGHRQFWDTPSLMILKLYSRFITTSISNMEIWYNWLQQVFKKLQQTFLVISGDRTPVKDKQYAELYVKQLQSGVWIDVKFLTSRHSQNDALSVLQPIKIYQLQIAKWDSPSVHKSKMFVELSGDQAPGIIWRNIVILLNFYLRNDISRYTLWVLWGLRTYIGTIHTLL